MKKIFSFVCAAVLGLSAQAQLVTSRSITKVATPVENRTTWMVRVGVGTNKFVGDDFKDFGTKAGYWLGAEFNKTLGKRGAYWGMDFALASRGYSYEDEYQKMKLAAHNIHWSPFIFGWKIDVADSDFSIDPHLGLFMSLDYAGKYKYESNNREETTKIGDATDYNRFDVGLKVGVGVWYKKRYNLDLTFQRGFLADDTDYDGGTSNFMVRLGYAF